MTSSAPASWEERKPLFLVGGGLVLALLVGSWTVADDLSENRARAELRTALGAASGLTINGDTVQQPAAVVAALRGVTHVPAHHSSPTTPIRLQLTGGARPMAITIARDSENSDEFWVYRPGRNWHKDPLGQDAGRVVSRDLDAFLRRRGL